MTNTEKLREDAARHGGDVEFWTKEQWADPEDRAENAAGCAERAWRLALAALEIEELRERLDRAARLLEGARAVLEAFDEWMEADEIEAFLKEADRG